MNQIEVATLLTASANQVEKFAGMYKNLQPKEDVLVFKQPNYELVQEIRNQGEIFINPKNAVTVNRNGANGNGTPGPNGAQAMTMASSLLARQEPRSSNSPSNGDNLVWTNPNNDATNTTTTNASPLVTSARQSYASIVKPAAMPSIAFGQAIPGWDERVEVKLSVAPSKWNTISSVVFQ